MQNIKISRGLAMQKIQYYFDFLSPYSYFSWKNKNQFNNYQDIEIEIKPVVMGTIFNKNDMKGPGEILAKRHYMLKQCFIYAAQNNIAFIPPSSHPFNPLYALRLATKACSGFDQERIIEILMNACWSNGQILSEPEFLIELLNEHGLNGQDLIDKTFSKEVKSELKANTNEALEQSCFGVPSFVFNQDLYWGNDSIANLKLAIENKFPKWNKSLFLDRIKG